MKLPILFSLLFAGSAFAAPLHLDLEMTSEEYTKLLKQMEKSSSGKNKMKVTLADDPAITRAIKLGQRLSQWIAKVNETRTPTTAIRLTSPNTRSGIPIDQPSIYSPSTVKEKTDTALNEIPASIKDVLTSSNELPSTVPVDDETFIVNARKIDKIYQTAARYKSVDQYRSSYIAAASRDVRGYYYLTTNNITADSLKDVGSIDAAKVTPIKDALALICFNDEGNLKSCKARVEKAFANNTVADFFTKYMAAAKENWDSFYNIPSYGRRSDIGWANNTATIPFNTPKIPKFGPYLKDNIEDEWKWNDWHLRLNFGSFENGPYLKFETGVVPHVNELGGNEITMDSNQPIEEYESQWTIRHEFGHVLGFPDCYHEFYDTNLKAYVNYQLDISDLMCSRAGNMKERLYLEMKRNYEK